MPTALVIKHESISPPDMIDQAAEARGFDLHVVYAEDGRETTYPDPAAVDVVIVNGSAGHWYEIDQYPYLQAEMAFIEEAIAVGTPILGMCFGGQALSMALGGTVEAMASDEIGWFEVDSTDESTIPRGPWFMWHEDHFTVPEGAELLATTDEAIHAFRLGPHLGLQFHPEINYDVMACFQEWLPEHVDADEFVRQTKENEPEARRRAIALFDTFLSFSEDA